MGLPPDLDSLLELLPTSNQHNHLTACVGSDSQNWGQDLSYKPELHNGGNNCNKHRTKVNPSSVSDFILHMNNTWYPCIHYNELTRWLKEKERERETEIYIPPNERDGIAGYSIIRQQHPNSVTVSQMKRLKCFVFIYKLLVMFFNQVL